MASGCRYESADDPRFSSTSNSNTVDDETMFEDLMFTKWNPRPDFYALKVSPYGARVCNGSLHNKRCSKKDPMSITKPLDTRHSKLRAIFDLHFNGGEFENFSVISKNDARGDLHSKRAKVDRSLASKSTKDEPDSECAPRSKLLRHLADLSNKRQSNHSHVEDKERCLLNEELKEWRAVIGWLPDKKVADMLLKRYLLCVNIWMCGVDYEVTSDDIDEVYSLRDNYFAGKPCDITKKDIHKIGIILLICHMGRLSLGDPQTVPSYDHEKPGQGYYIGSLVRNLCFAILDMTSLVEDASIWYTQLLYLLIVHSAMTSGEALEFSRLSHWTHFIEMFVKSCAHVGLHRDPIYVEDTLPIKMMRFWRMLWRQCVYIDTVLNLDILVPPYVQLKYSDTKLYDDDGSESKSVDDVKDEECRTAMRLAAKHTKELMEWCSVTRELLDRVILMPSSKITLEDVTRCSNSLNAYKESAIHIDFKQFLSTLSDDNDSKPFDYVEEATLISSERMFSRFYLIKYVLNLAVRSKFDESLEDLNSSSLADSAQIALLALKAQGAITEKLDRFTYNHLYVSRLLMRNVVPLWLSVVSFLVVQVSSEGPQILSNVELLRESVKSYRWITKFAGEVYYSWKLHILLNRILKNLKSFSLDLVKDPEWTEIWAQYDDIKVIEPEKQWDTKLSNDIQLLWW